MSVSSHHLFRNAGLGRDLCIGPPIGLVALLERGRSGERPGRARGVDWMAVGDEADVADRDAKLLGNSARRRMLGMERPSDLVRVKELWVGGEPLGLRRPLQRRLPGQRLAYAVGDKQGTCVLLEGLIDGNGQLPSEDAVPGGVDAGRRGTKPDVRRAAGEQLEQVVLEPAEPRV